MFTELVTKLNKAKSFAEILRAKPSIEESYDAAYEKLCERSCFIQNYRDIEALHNLGSSMAAYFGPAFYQRCGIPFLKEHNPVTLEIIEFSILFYTLQMCELIENGLLKEEEVRLIEDSWAQEMFFCALWEYFTRLIIAEDIEDRRIEIGDGSGGFTVRILDDSYFEEMVDVICRNYGGSKYSRIITRIFGMYQSRFTKMLYIIKCQPLFVEVGFEYLSAVAAGAEPPR